MYKILLCCNAGMSTSMVVKKMQAAALEKNIEVEIKAIGMESFDEEIEKFDCCLLGPQIKYRLDEFKTKGDEINKPVQVINSIDYGMMNGKKILEDIISIL